MNTTNFSIDQKGQIVVLDGRLDKINTYDENSGFVSSAKLPFKADVFQCLDDGNYLLGLSSWNKGLNTNDKIIKANSNLNSLNAFCQYEKGTDPNYGISTYQFLNTGKYIIYNRFLDNHLFVFKKWPTY